MLLIVNWEWVNMPTENGHDFDFTKEKCNNCGMPESSYQDNGKPRCSGRKKTVKFGGDRSEPKKPTTTKKKKYI